MQYLWVAGLVVAGLCGGCGHEVTVISTDGSGPGGAGGSLGTGAGGAGDAGQGASGAGDAGQGAGSVRAGGTGSVGGNGTGGAGDMTVGGCNDPTGDDSCSGGFCDAFPLTETCFACIQAECGVEFSECATDANVDDPSCLDCTEFLGGMAGAPCNGSVDLALDLAICVCGQ